MKKITLSVALALILPAIGKTASPDLTATYIATLTEIAQSQTVTDTMTFTPSATPTNTMNTLNFTQTVVAQKTAAGNVTYTYIASSWTPTFTVSPTITPSVTKTITKTPTPTPTPSATRSITRTFTPSPAATATPTATTTMTPGLVIVPEEKSYQKYIRNQDSGAVRAAMLTDSRGVVYGTATNPLFFAAATPGTISSQSVTVVAWTGYTAIYTSGQTILKGYITSTRTLAGGAANGTIATLMDAGVTKCAIDLTNNVPINLGAGFTFSTNMYLNYQGGGSPGPLTLIMQR